MGEKGALTPSSSELERVRGPKVEFSCLHAAQVIDTRPVEEYFEQGIDA